MKKLNTIISNQEKILDLLQIKSKESNRLLESKKFLLQASIKCKTTKDSMVIYGKDKIEKQNKSIVKTLP